MKGDDEIRSAEVPLPQNATSGERDAPCWSKVS
jgi:hypothetical protein